MLTESAAAKMNETSVKGSDTLTDSMRNVTAFDVEMHGAALGVERKVGIAQRRVALCVHWQSVSVEKVQVALDQDKSVPQLLRYGR